MRYWCAHCSRCGAACGNLCCYRNVCHTADFGGEVGCDSCAGGCGARLGYNTIQAHGVIKRTAERSILHVLCRHSELHCAACESGEVDREVAHCLRNRLQREVLLDIKTRNLVVSIVVNEVAHLSSLAGSRINLDDACRPIVLIEHSPIDLARRVVACCALEEFERLVASLAKHFCRTTVLVHGVELTASADSV